MSGGQHGKFPSDAKALVRSFLPGAGEGVLRSFKTVENVGL